MDNLITLIVIVIAILSFFRKFKAKQKKPSISSAPGSAWLSQLKAFLNDIQKQIERQSRDRSPAGSGWDRLLDSAGTDSSSSDTDETVLEDQLLADAKRQAPPRKVAPAATDRVPPTRLDRTRLPAATALKMDLPAGKPSNTIMAAGRADLRKAVIWSEILGPPIALRNQSSGQR